MSLLCLGMGNMNKIPSADVFRRRAGFLWSGEGLTGTKYVGEKNKKEFANDLKAIYQAPSEKAALEQLERITEKWEKDYPNAMKSWHTNWDVISPIFKFSAQVRKVIYTTNAIESLNSGYRRLNKQRSVFPSDTALLKVLYLATTEISKKWTMPLRDWGKVLGELEIMYPDRLN